MTGFASPFVQLRPVRPRLRRPRQHAGDGDRRRRVRRAFPSADRVTRGAQRRVAVVLDEELSPLVAVRVVAGRAVDFACAAEGETGRRRGLELRVRKRALVRERDRMMHRQVHPEVGKAVRRQRVLSGHADADGRIEHASHRDRSVVARQAQLRGARRLPERCGLEGRARVQDVRARLELLVPQRRLRRGVVRRVAEHADARLVERADRSRSRDRKVVRGELDGLGRLRASLRSRCECGEQHGGERTHDVRHARPARPQGEAWRKAVLRTSLAHGRPPRGTPGPGGCTCRRRRACRPGPATRLPGARTARSPSRALRA